MVMALSHGVICPYRVDLKTKVGITILHQEMIMVEIAKLPWCFASNEAEAGQIPPPNRHRRPIRHGSSKDGLS